LIQEEEDEEEEEWHYSFIASECTAWTFLDLGMILPSSSSLLLLLLLMMRFIQEGYIFLPIWERDPLLDS
jgi:hypothetical protein